jgi:hypothetical protein
MEDRATVIMKYITATINQISKVRNVSAIIT